MDFIRYGSLVPQKHEIDKESFHAAPVEYGFYAFPRGYEEPFLLSGVGRGNIKNGRYRFLRDDNGKKIEAKWADMFDTDKKCIKEPYASLAKKRALTYNSIQPYLLDGDGVLLDYFDLEDLATGPLSDTKLTYVYENKPTKFKYTGNIWHHLEQYGQKTIVPDAYIIKRSLSESWILTDIKTYEMALEKFTKMTKQSLNRYFKSSNPQGIPFSSFSKDEYEVFIEKI